MNIVNFIEFNTDKMVAQSIRTSPMIKIHTFTGVQLLPNNNLPYIQTTNVNGGIELEDWTAYVVDACTGIETDITDYFLVDRIFQDTNGQAQFDWKITNVPFDFGNNLVYLKVSQAIGETFYSNLFQFTEYESEKTCRIDYKSKENDTMQSIQLQMFFWQPLKQSEIGSYYEVSTRNTVTTTVKSQKYERWVTDFINTDLVIKLSDLFESKFVYVNLIRANLFEAIELKEHEAEGDFEENIIKLAFNRSDVYDPNYIEPVASVIPSITLSDLVTNGINAIYSFSYENLNPTYLTFQTSQNQTDWTSTNKGVSSPQSIPFNGTGVWYFRIIHPEAKSNIIEIDLGSSVIANNDASQVLKGGSIEINVLFNDSLVGTTTITSVSSPTNGIAQIIESGTKIRYTHNGSNTSFDSFTYTISNGITTDTATVSMVITNDATIKSFQTSLIGSTYNYDACYLDLPQTRYHNGIGLSPNIGDYVFDAPGGIFGFNGENKYFAIYGGKVIRINPSGEVTDVYIC